MTSTCTPAETEEATRPSPAVECAVPFGFVYVATGDKYRQEAAASAATLRTTTPQARICLVTDRATGPVFWDDLIVFDRPRFTFRDKLEMRRCPYERFVFLDTDTVVTDDLNCLDAMLGRFDFIGHQLFEGHDIVLPEIPDAFPEFNSGVLGFRRGPVAEKLFDRWEANFARFFAENTSEAYHYSNVSDQKSLRVSLWESDARIGVLGPEYNFVPHHVNFACASVRILHTRQAAAGSELISRLNQRLSNRVYVPHLDVVLNDDPPRKELFRLWLMSSLQLLRAAARALAPMRLRDWLRDRSLIRHLFLRNRFMNVANQEDSKWQRDGTTPQ